jgi:hypothetical protein
MAAKNNKPSKPGALSTKPSTAASTAPKKAADGLKRLSPGIYRNPAGELTNSQGKRIDSRGRPVKVTPPKKETKPQGPAQPQTPDQKFRGMNEQQQNKQLYEDAGSFYNKMMGNAMQIDPNNPVAGYQPAFQNQLDQARSTVMNQFEATMGPQFQREQAAFNERMAIQGIDPNSGRYKDEYKAMMDSQNSQRMQAQTQAFQLGAGYQQQGFEQGVTGQMMPAQIWQATSKPWELQYAAGQEAQQNELTRQAQLQQARIGGGASTRAAQIAADASRYATDMNALNQGYNQNQRPNMTNQIIGGVVTGATAGLMK